MSDHRRSFCPSTGISKAADKHAAMAALVLFMQLVSAVGDLTVYVGSGGCDGSDSSCVPDPSGQKVLKSLSLSDTGELRALDRDVAVDDLPVWITGTGSGCLFVARPNRNDLVSLMVGVDGRLSPVSSTPSGGRTPVFAAPSVDQRFLLVANYNGPDDTKVSNGATAASFRIEQDCRLTLVDSKIHAGSSVDPQRQGAAHVHSLVPARDGFLFACDLGMDLIFMYKLQSDGKLTEISRTRTAPGLGPRHLVQHPSKPVVYVVCEMGEVVLSFKQTTDGMLSLMQTLSLLPEGASAANSKAAEIVIKADGTALYATNRGIQNTVTAFKVDWDGSLQKLQEVHAPGFPRGMTLALGDSFLVVGGQSESVVATYRIQPSGFLETPSRSTDHGLPPNPAAFLVLPGSAQVAI